MSGVPVITALWNNYRDVFIEGITGWGYEFDNYEALRETLIRLVQNPEQFFQMKKTALMEAEKYLPDNAVSKILDNFQ